MKKTEQEPVKMLTTKEVAERLDADPGTIRMWCINGTFPNAKQEETGRGPVWLIPETDLSGFQRRGRGRPSKQNKTSTKPISNDASVNESKPTKESASSRSNTKAEKRARAVKKSVKGKKNSKRGNSVK